MAPRRFARHADAVTIAGHLETGNLDLPQFHDELYKSTLECDSDLSPSQHGYSSITELPLRA